MFEKIKNLLIENMGIDETLITPEAKLIADLELNSLELAEFILTCEEEFKISIKDEDLKKLVCVGDIADYVENNG
ncbi:MAG: acyl carrier protein [Oscillospiraceae bacterium]|nr:acyl carrier protein [Oscillospiraceae bacterium]